MHEFYVTFKGVSVHIVSDWAEMIEVLKKDFSSLIAVESAMSRPIKISINRANVIPEIPEMQASMQTQNALTYDVEAVRYCDYYGKVYTRTDFILDESIVYGDDFERVHEITYLLLLSRLGKKLDLKGFHKLHAFAVSFEGLAFVCMMPSQGGKSTLLLELLKDERIKMMSDDIPMFDTFGRVYSFPLKLGLSERPKGLEIFNEKENLYRMQRQHHGEKILLSTRGIPQKVEVINQGFDKIILAEAFRFHSDKSFIIKSSWLSTFKGLFKHGVIGVGSPIIFEYFWQNTWADFFIKTKIFFNRVLAFFNLSIKAKKLKILSGRHPELTAKFIITFLENEAKHNHP